MCPFSNFLQERLTNWLKIAILYYCSYVLVQIKIMQVTPHDGQQNWSIFILLKSNYAKTRKNMFILCYHHSGNHGNGK